MNCPDCGKFLRFVRAERWALKPSGGKILVYLTGDKCHGCGYAKIEKYANKVKLLKLLPYRAS